MRRLLVVLPAYALLSLLALAVWTLFARLEWDVERLDTLGPDGVHYSLKYTSVVRLVEGRAFSPFVRRRLLPDLTRAVVAVLPRSLWQTLDRRLQGDGPLAARGRHHLWRQGWRAEDYPVLFTAHALIGLGIFGFMLTCRRLIPLLYETPAWMADLLGGLLGVGLLGGNGDWHYNGYPYDFPHAFVFTLALTGLLARRWWFPLALALASYSKETAVLLLLAYALLAEDRRSPRFWGRLALLGLIYGAVQGWLRWQYHTPEGGFWYPGRNCLYAGFQVFHAWLVPLAVIVAVRLRARWHEYPLPLRRLSLLALPLLGLALFKGWIEEGRQYLEMLPILGPIAIQCMLSEIGLGRLLRPRREEEENHGFPGWHGSKPSQTAA
jgi:hypothetical protein